MNGSLDLIGALQIIAAALAGFLAGRGRVREHIRELERENERLEARLSTLQAQLNGTLREQTFTNALVVELVRRYGMPRDFQVATPDDDGGTRANPEA